MNRGGQDPGEQWAVWDPGRLTPRQTNNKKGPLPEVISTTLHGLHDDLMRKNYWNQEEQWVSGVPGGFQQCPRDKKESDIKERVWMCSGYPGPERRSQHRPQTNIHSGRKHSTMLNLEGPWASGIRHEFPAWGGFTAFLFTFMMRARSAAFCSPPLAMPRRGSSLSFSFSFLFPSLNKTQK